MKVKFLVFICGLAIAQTGLADTGMENKPAVPPPVEKTFPTNSSVLSLVTPQIGLNVANIEGSGSSGSTTSGLNIGATVDLGRSNFVFETGLLYRQEGATLNDGFISATLTLGYLSIPLLGKIYFNGAENNSFFAKFGLLPNILIDKKIDFAGNTYSDVTGLNSFVLDGMVGIGGKFKVTESNDIVVELTYSRSLTSAIASQSGTANSVIGLDVGFSFEM